MIQAETSSSTPTVAWTLVLAGVLAIVAVSVAMLRRPRLVVADPPALVPANFVLFRAPRIKGMSLRDWLIYLTSRDGVWREVVAEFYGRASQDDEIAPYFEHVDVERLQGHFLSTLLILTHTGLTVGLLAQLQERHAGLGITGSAFDRTITILAEVLISKGVVAETIRELGPMIAEIRGMIVEEAA